MNSEYQRAKNFKIAWLGTFMAGMAFSEAMPFLALYIMQLGHYTDTQVSFYAGISYAASYLIVILVSPIWGWLADKFGRKPMLIRTAFGMGIVIILISTATHLWQIIVLRLIQGFFDGYTPSAIALIASETSVDKRASVISKLSTGYIIGGLLGPVVGGILATVFSIRMTFTMTGIILLLVGGLSYFGIQEKFQKQEKITIKKDKKLSIVTGQLLILLMTVMTIQLVESLITPYIGLMVKKMIVSTHDVMMGAGIISALPGVATAIFAVFIGKLGDKFGSRKVLMVAEGSAIIIYFVLGMVHSLIIFAVLRFLTGISNAALTPSVQALLSKTSDRISTVFSISLSAQSFGSLLGSILGAFLTQYISFTTLFLLASVFFLVNFIILRKFKFAIKS
ncbi:MFS transporter [Leuconostoc miyukkimchii]|uniref:MFS transporter n=1 Tax=Leuconostoc miyukkimchii TaxID=910540 RepID=UPI001C7D1242|nr:MFS transporter [Leuconostoc miyukkimchii]